MIVPEGAPPAGGKVERLPRSGPGEPVSPGPPLAPDMSGGGGGPQASGTTPTRMIDLPAALRLADRANPEIGITRQAIEESIAVLFGARVLLVPSIHGGANYHNHNGSIQRSNGTIFNLPEEQSLFFGGGARTLAAESMAFPGIQIFSHLGDAIFEPLAARQEVQARTFDAGATFNMVLMDVSTRYIDLMAAEAQLEFLYLSHRDAEDVAQTTTSFARVGQAREADADRVTTEARLIDSDVQHAIGQRAVASAELARLLNLDPSVQLRTIGGAMPIVQLIDPKYTLNELLEVAGNRRPELGARSARIVEAEYRYRQERTRPLLPTISIGFSAGSFGGGSTATAQGLAPFSGPTASGVPPNFPFGNFAARTDFDVLAFWTAQNFGIGNMARWRARRAQVNEAVATRVRMLNTVRAEVAEAYAAANANFLAIDVARRRLVEAEDGFHEEFNRIRGGEGLPIELLDNLTRLVSARKALVDAIAAYDRSQFQLFVSLGQPPTWALPNAGRLGVEAGQ